MRTKGRMIFGKNQENLDYKNGHNDDLQNIHKSFPLS